MAVFTAYFDVSGTKEERVLTIAGFVSRTERWTRFENDWKSLLPATLSVFHMTDFVNSQKGWEGWKGDTERRVHFFDSLIACIKKHTNQGFAVSVQLQDFRDIDREYMFHEAVGKPYAFLARACLGRLKKWAKKKPTDWRKILCILEHGDEGQGEALKRLIDEGYNAILQSKADVRAFDACDLAAWKARAIVDDAWERKLHLSDPKAADRIMRSLEKIEIIVRGKEVGMYSRKGLTNICEKLSIPKRA
jgi:hypothetical protein